ncbi:MAG: hypothetical protein KC621_06145, partial [Myxococcales bacterium]|nr:hypothetical protein [Myxococcales bacterium]
AGGAGGGNSLKDLMAAHGRVDDNSPVGASGATLGGGGGGADGIDYGAHTGGLAGQGGGGAQGGDGNNLKDLLAAHGRVDGQAVGEGGGGAAGLAEDAGAAAGGRRAAIKDALGGKGGADFKKAFEAAKKVADAKKQGE